MHGYCRRRAQRPRRFRAVAMQSWGWRVPSALTLGFACGIACGALNGQIGVARRMPSLIVTLGMLEVARGRAYLATDSKTKYIGSAIDSLSAALCLGISPAFFLNAAIVIAKHIALRRSVFRRYLRLVLARIKRLWGSRVWSGGHRRLLYWCSWGYLRGIM